MSETKKRVNVKADAQMVFYFPVHGCDEARPMTGEEQGALVKRLRKCVKEQWNNPGVRALVQWVEMQAGTLQARACSPGATAHDAGQGHALLRLVSEVQGMRWG